MTKSTGREDELWTALWSKPQAVEWERLGVGMTVALYVRALVVAEQLDATVSARTLAKQLGEDLGLTVGGMARNNWKIESAPVEVKPARRSSSRSRLKVVTDAGA